MAESKLVTVLRCAEADLYDFIVNWMDLNPETADVPAAQTWREIVQVLSEGEK